MKKIIHISLGTLIALSNLPLTSFATEVVNTPPIFVRIRDFNTDVSQLRNDVINQERLNQEEELSIRNLAQENVTLIEKSEGMHSEVSSYADVKSIDLNQSIETLRNLKVTMEHYSRQLDERNRQMMERNEETMPIRSMIESSESASELTEKFKEQRDLLIDKNKALIDKNEQLIALKAELERKTPGQEFAALPSNSQELEKSYKEQRDLLIEKNKALIEKNQQLLDLKARMQQADEEVKALQTKIQEADHKSPKVTPEVFPTDRQELQKSYKEQRDILIEKNKTLAEKNQQLLELRAQVKSSTEEVRVLKEKIDTMSVKTMGEPRIVASGNNTDLEKNFKEQRDLLIEKNKSLIEKNQQLLDFKAQLQKTKEELESVNARYEGLAQKVTGLKHNTESNSTTIKEEASQLNTRVEGLEPIRERIEQYQVSLKEKDGLVAQLQATILEKDALIAQLRLDLATAQKALAQAQDDRGMRTKNSDEQLSFNLIHQNVNEMKQSIADLKETLYQEDEGFERIRANIVMLQKELADTKAANSQLMGDITAKNEEIESKAKKITQLEGQLKEALTYQDMIKQVHTHMMALVEEEAALKKSIEGLWTIKERLELHEKLLAKHHLLEKLATEKVGLLEDLSKADQDQIQSTQENIKKTVKYWQDIKIKDDTTLNNLKRDADLKQTEINKLQQTIQDNQKQAAQLDSMLDVYQKNIDTKDGASKKKLDEIAQLQGDLQTAQDNLKERETDLKKVREFFFELEKTSAAKNDKIRDQSQQIALLNLNLEEQTLNQTALGEKLRSAEERLKKAVDPSALQSTGKLLDSATKEILDLKATLKDQQKKILDYEAQFKNQMSFEAQAKQQMQEIVELKEKLRLAEEKLKSSVDVNQTGALMDAATQEILTLKEDLRVKEDKIQEFELHHLDQGQMKDLDAAKNTIKKLMEDIYYKDKQIARLKMQLAQRRNAFLS